MNRRAPRDTRPERAIHVEAAAEYQATTVQAAGLFPFTAGSGAPATGVPLGRHLLWGEVVALDPFAWLEAGLTTNRGIFVLGQPGTGKSAAAKRLCRGSMAFGITPLFLGDAKPDYTRLVRAAGGQVIRVGRGLDRINPLDSGPLGAALTRLTGQAAATVRAEVRGRRISAVLALAALVRTSDPVTNGEEAVIGTAIDLLTDGRATSVGAAHLEEADGSGGPRRSQGWSDEPAAEPTVPDVLRLLREAPDALMSAAEVDTRQAYDAETRRLRQTLRTLCDGSLRGVFDGPTTTALDLDAPAISVDISAVASSGDTLLAAAMLSTWSYGFAVIDAAAALADAGLAPRRRFIAVLDELWRALRGAPGLVDHADALTRVYRGRDVAHLMLTHSLDDLSAMPREADRAKARGFLDRCAITVLAGLPARELNAVSAVVPLSAAEKQLVASWSSPESWQAGGRHPGRGKYLIKTGQRIGIPVQMELVGDEPAMYDTDHRFTP